jgi:hypothetical protein
LKLMRDDGELMAEVDDADGGDGVLGHTFPDDGTYCLLAEDLHRAGSSSHVYRIDVEQLRPGFSLTTETDVVNPPHGGTFVVLVKANRVDYTGPIELSINGAGEGVQLTDHVIQADKNETTVKVTLPESIQAGELRLVQIVGKAMIEEQEVTATASTMPAYHKLIPSAIIPAGLPED